MAVMVVMVVGDDGVVDVDLFITEFQPKFDLRTTMLVCSVRTILLLLWLLTYMLLLVVVVIVVVVLAVLVMLVWWWFDYTSFPHNFMQSVCDVCTALQNVIS